MLAVAAWLNVIMTQRSVSTVQPPVFCNFVSLRGTISFSRFHGLMVQAKRYPRRLSWGGFSLFSCVLAPSAGWGVPRNLQQCILDYLGWTGKVGLDCCGKQVQRERLAFGAHAVPTLVEWRADGETGNKHHVFPWVPRVGSVLSKWTGRARPGRVPAAVRWYAPGMYSFDMKRVIHSRLCSLFQVTIGLFVILNACQKRCG
jgi:hypothetical protein